jgi:hypothetical protein
MFTDTDGPIELFEWGRFKILGEIHSMDGEGVGKDIFLFNKQVKAWKARKGHRLSPEMVTKYITDEIDVLVIGNGVNGALKVPKKTRSSIKAAGVKRLIVERTPQACAIYNQLARRGDQVALLAHGTC